MASVDQISAVCRANVRSSLSVTSKLLQSSEPSASRTLLSRMNDALGGIVETNFGSSTNDHLSRLYAAIDETQPALVDESDNLAFYYFSRSLAVVLEEAVRQKEERASECGKKERGDGANEGCGHEEYGSEKGKEEKKEGGTEEYGSEKGKEEKKEGRTEEYGREEKTAVVDEKENDSGLSSESSSPPPPSSLTPASPSSSSHEVHIWSTLPEEWRAKSQEEINGLIAIKGVSPHIGHDQLETFLKIMGSIAELKLYPRWEGWRTGFAVCRYESEDAACAAVGRFHLKMFLGSKLYVTRVHPTHQDAETLENSIDAEKSMAISATNAVARENASSPTDTALTEISDLNAVSCLDSDDDDQAPPPSPLSSSIWDPLDEVD